jgi:hypothetical protein
LLLGRVDGSGGRFPATRARVAKRVVERSVLQAGGVSGVRRGAAAPTLVFVASSPPLAGSAERSPAAIRAGDDLEEVPVRVGEVDPSAAVVVVDLARAAAPRVGPVRQIPRPDATEYLVELRLADEASAKSRLTPLATSTTMNGPNGVGAASPSTSARNPADV